MRRYAAGACVALALWACSSSEPEWGVDYSVAVKTRIDQAALTHDCAALQAEFDQANAQDSADLMSYINDKMESAGCYG